MKKDGKNEMRKYYIFACVHCAVHVRIVDAAM